MFRRVSHQCSTWIRDNLLITFCLIGVMFLMLGYLRYCYIDPDEGVMVWIQYQTVNTDTLQSPNHTVSIRLPSKYRMLNPVLLFFDYPIGRYLAYDLHLKDIPGVNANLVSIIHPIVAVTAAILMVKAVKEHPSPQAPPTPPDVEMNDEPQGFDSLIDKPNRKSQPEGPYVNLYMVRVAALLFSLRNTLDTLDGVLARAQRSKKIETTIGFNGHLLDVVTDMFGVTVFLLAVWRHYYKAHVRVERHNFPLIKQAVQKLQDLGMSSLSVSRVLLFLAVAMICLNGLSWETTMLRMQRFFDTNTNNLEVMALERHPIVQIIYFCWSISCSDALFSYLVLALLLNAGHGFLIIMSVYGWTWLTFLSLISAAATRWIANHPVLLSAAAK